MRRRSRRAMWIQNQRLSDSATFVPRALLFAALPAALLAAAVAGAFAEKSGRANIEGGEVHHVVILIDSDDEKIMGHAISYSVNITRAFAVRHQRVQIEIVANGSGIKLLRADTSPLQQPLAMLRQTLPDVTLSMCDSSRQIAEQKDGHTKGLVDGARLVPFGIGRVVELQEAGWSYVHG